MSAAVRLRAAPARNWVIASVTARRSILGAAVWGGAFGLTVAASVVGYIAAYPTAASRVALARSLGTNAGLRALFGPPRGLATVAGFAAWRTLGLAGLIGAVWGLLAATKALRGEEDAGRWEVLLSGRTTRGRAAAQAVAGLGVALLTLFGVTGVIVVLAGLDRDARFSLGSSLYFALALVAAAAMFLALGALASQLAATRRAASLLGAGALGISFVLKVIGDAGSSTAFFIWTSPLGWVEELRPLTGPQPFVLAPIAALTLGAGGLAVWLASGRDLGASTLPSRDERAARRALLAGPTALATRLAGPSAGAWIGGLAALGLLFGFVAKSAAAALSGSARVSTVVSRLIGRGGAEAYLGFMFLLVATLAGLVAASQLVAMRDEELSGRLDNLLVRPVTTWRWSLGRLGVATAAILASSIAGSLGAWAGAALEHTGVAPAGMLDAAANAAAAGLAVLGIGAFAYGVRPRATAAVAYGLVAASYLIELVGSVIRANHYLLDLSILYHLAPAPAVPLEWGGIEALVAIGVLGSIAGCAAFAHRDVVGA